MKERKKTTLHLAGVDPGFREGGGTGHKSGENSKVNDIHDVLSNVRSNHYT